MRVGALVKNEEYGTLGVVTETGDVWVYVTWLTMPDLDPVWYIVDLEILCK